MNKEVIVISAVWCPSCLILKKILKKLNSEYEDIKITTLDYDFDEDEVKKYNVKDKLPVIISLDNNEEIKRLVGERSYEEVLEFLKESGVV